MLFWMMRFAFFDPEKGEYHNLNKVGTDIWQILNTELIYRWNR